VPYYEANNSFDMLSGQVRNETTLTYE